ncbi:MAG: PEPxxWA-CTERM sorting domain-containing protein [Pseudomonadota bacterium]
MKKYLLAAAASMVFAMPANAALVDFNSAPGGAVSEGTDIGGIIFTSALGSGLSIGSFAESNNSPALAAFNDGNGNFILGAIASGANHLSLEFGNDDPGFTNPGDLATLQLFSGAILLDTVTVLLNRDDMMNQTISYSGAAFDNFSFAYTDAAGNPFTGGGGAAVGLIEVIDNINFAAVPEPATWAFMIFGFGAIGGAMRRQRKANVKVSYA